MRGWPWQGRKAQKTDKTEIVHLTPEELNSCDMDYMRLQQAVVEYAYRTGNAVHVEILEKPDEADHS
jgi:hypothetical protein